MHFRRLVDYWQKIEPVSGRLEMTQLLSEMLKQADQSEIDKVCYLTLGRLGPAYDKLELGLAEKLLMRSLAYAVGAELSQISKLYTKLGDIGEVAESLPAEKSQSDLTVTQVYQHLKQIALLSGSGSQEQKIQQFAQLLNQMGPAERHYTARIAVGKLRLGLKEMTIIDALSWLVTGDKSLRSEIESAFNLAADIGYIASLVRSAADQSVEQVKQVLAEVKLEPGRPLIVALCQRLPTFDEIITKMREVACEPKYDGMRLQLHWQKDTGLLKAFTRNLEENSDMFPELKQAVKHLSARSVILDGEVLGIDPVSGNFVPFQVTMTRKRKHEISQQADKVPVRYMVFDVLYLDGQDVHRLPYHKRRQLLLQVVTESDHISPVPSEYSDDPNRLRQLHHTYLEEGYEGVVVKKKDSPYTPGRKGWHWVKMKESEEQVGKLADTIDAVVMGYYYGRGKRTALGLGSFLVGVVDDTTDAERYLTLSKIGTGLTDEQIRQLTQQLNQLRVEHQPSVYQVDENLMPDVWVEPELVVVVAADNLTFSPIHTSGYGLRFPRLVRIRTDKSAQQATTLSEIKQLYQLQQDAGDEHHS